MTTHASHKRSWSTILVAALRRQAFGDGGVALAMLVWVGVVWALARAASLSSSWRAGLLVAGVIVILIENVLRSVRQRQRGD